MELLIDNREKIKDALTHPEFNTLCANLVLGDYLYRINGVDAIIIERKTMEDYAASIKDGRLREQKARLLANYSRNQIIYLVEGNISVNNQSFAYNKVAKETIVSSMVNTMLRDGISVFRTCDVAETVYFIQTLYKKLQKQGTGFMKKAYSYEDTLVKATNKKKNKNITKRICQKMMFTTIPNISLVTANRLLAHFGSIQQCLEVLSKLKDTDRLAYLQNISVAEGVKFRKISKTSCQNILVYLLD
tara:strand:- start:1118 stop:1855 length:738 start_codon:yes stop_codon:yes gene_type:complete